MANNSLTTWVSGSDYKTLSVTPPSSSISYSVWIKPHSTGIGYNLMTLYNGATSRLLKLKITNSRQLGNETWDGTNLINTFISTALTADAWNHCAIVWTVSGSNVVSTLMYLNGTPDTADTTTVALVTGGDFWFGGVNEGNTVGAGDGTCKVAFPAIYGTALSSTDVTNLQTRFPTSVQASSLKSYWIFDTATSIADQASNGWTLTNVNTASALDSDVPSLTSGGSSIITKVKAFRTMQMGD